MQDFARVRVSGPLARHADGFAAELIAHGYTDLSCVNQLRLLADLSGWLEEVDLAIGGLTSKLVDRFLARRRRRHAHLVSRRALGPLLDYLRAVGELAATSIALTELDHRHEQYMVQECGLTPAIRARYRDTLHALLGDRSPTELDAAAVDAYVRRLGRGRGLVVALSALRAVLRFLSVTGATATDLRPLVPSAPRWQQTELPKALTPAMFRAVLSSCDRRTETGRRDHAAVLLMLRMGLRAGEAARLTLDDVDWVAGDVVIRGKGGRLDRLPLPADVGAALVSYLRRRRPSRATRALFLTVRAPIRAATASTMIGLARQALRRAGVATGGAHRLRHTAATQMLQRGGSLTEIAQVLRHRSINTTAIYAKVDRARLRDLASPWPAGATVDVRAVQRLALPWGGGGV